MISPNLSAHRRTKPYSRTFAPGASYLARYKEVRRMTLAEIGERLQQQGIFSGGPPQLFESAGRLQLATLVREGLYPYSRLLDIGCGCLRAGYWIIRLLDPGYYYGIEPNRTMLQAGIEQVIGPELQAAKRPSFDTNDRYDFSVF